MIRPGTVGALVERERRQRGLTLRELAGRLELSAPYLHDVEHGRRLLAPERWERLVGVLEGLTLEELASAAVGGVDHVEVPVDRLTPQQRREAEQTLLKIARAPQIAAAERSGG